MKVKQTVSSTRINRISNFVTKREQGGVSAVHGGPIQEGGVHGGPIQEGGVHGEPLDNQCRLHQIF